MDVLSVIVIAVALAMDAFSVSISAGMVIGRPTIRHYFRLSFHFGLFQFMMPVVGYFAGMNIERYIRHYDHWVAFAMLAFIGARMIHESFSHEQKIGDRDPSRGMLLVVLSVATSIDALAVGLSFGVLNRPIFMPAVIIGVVCAFFSVAGVFIGGKATSFAGRRAGAVGGIMLIFIGMKILVEHLCA